MSKHHHLNLVSDRHPSAGREDRVSPSVEDTALPSVEDTALPSVEDTALLQVGELAKATGKTVRAIHLYESMGLIHAARRSKGRYRLFSPEVKGRIGWIGKLQSLGLSLSEIQAIVQQRQQSDSASRAAQQLRDVYSVQLGHLRQEMAKLRELEAELTASLNFLDTCAVDCSGSEQDDCASCGHSKSGTPDLVVGARIR